MKRTTELRQTVIDIFHTHNPIGADCLSVYEKVVDDLFRYWSYDDSRDELEAYIRGVLFMNANRSIPVSPALVSALYDARKLVR